MKKLLIILLPLMLLACSREKVERPLYQKYAERDELTVAQVSGFQLNDSVKVDVVILVADDTEAWERLKEEFEIRADEGVTSWMGDVDEPRKRVKGGELPAWRAIAVEEEKTLALYHIDNEKQYDALLDYQLREIEN